MVISFIEEIVSNGGSQPSLPTDHTVSDDDHIPIVQMTSDNRPKYIKFVNVLIIIESNFFMFRKYAKIFLGDANTQIVNYDFHTPGFCRRKPKFVFSVYTVRAVQHNTL